jgi:tRNA dimethylallyltransferase
VIAMLEGRAGLDETVAQVQTRTRQFAKRQRTWFRGLQEVQPWPIADSQEPEEVANLLASQVNQEN